VIDVWDSLISNRPYRSAWPKDKVISYIQEMSGTHFDPAIAEIFLAKRIWAEDSTEISINRSKEQYEN
jgi:response regulator RpfG family c-di-GMP phosphodiesterase